MNILRARFLYLIHLAVLASCVLIFLAYIRDAVNAAQIRRLVLKEVNLVDRRRLKIPNFAMNRRQPSQRISGFCTQRGRVDIDPLKPIVTLTFDDGGVDLVGKTLVFFLLEVDENGKHHLLRDEMSPSSAKWVCSSSMSLMRFAPELLPMRGTLPSNLAPAECRY